MPDSLIAHVPAGAIDYVYLKMFGADIIVGLTVNTSTDINGLKLVGLDWGNKLYYCSNGILNLLLPPMGFTPVLPLLAYSSTSDPLVIKDADVRVTHTPAPDRATLIVLLTFGGGSIGDRAGFAGSVMPAGSNVAILVDFRYLCRLIRKPIEDTLLNPGHDPAKANIFAACHLSQPVVVDAEKNVTMTALDISPGPSSLVLSATFRNSGFCYDATATASATVGIEVVQQDDGAGGTKSVLVVNSNVGEPDVGIDVPWYCYVGAALLGGIAIGIIDPAVDTVIGLILGSIISWVNQDLVEGTIKKSLIS